MNENRKWVVMRERDAYRCEVCGYAVPTMDGAGSRTAMTSVLELATLQQGQTHTINACPDCVRQVFDPHVADPFGLISRPISSEPSK